MRLQQVHYSLRLATDRAADESLLRGKVTTEIKGAGVEYLIRTLHNLTGSKTDELRNQVRAPNRHDHIKLISPAPDKAQKTIEVKSAKTKITTTKTSCFCVRHMEHTRYFIMKRLTVSSTMHLLHLPYIYRATQFIPRARSFFNASLVFER